MALKKRNRFSALEKNATTNPATAATLNIIGVENKGEEEITENLKKEEPIQDKITVPAKTGEVAPVKKPKNTKLEEIKTKETVTVHISPKHLKDAKVAILQYDLNMTLQELTEAAIDNYVKLLERRK
ncbi:hypothetical protein [Mucilaginibacter sp. UYCu711]|uniref:hypothetical protein n=1 Tax=Mucilaginibacter sp. UYCu711 TaxID=3156339 RepID=UPI003D1E2214